jgi:hypothetical protein
MENRKSGKGGEHVRKRTLYECLHARVNGDRIYCDKGCPLSQTSGNGHIDIERLVRGEALALAPCQKCADFDSMGPPISRNERGWLNRKRANYGRRNYEISTVAGKDT